MDSYFDALVEAFQDPDLSPQQLSIAPDLLEHGDGWRLAEPVPVEEIVNAFRVQDTLVQTGGQVLIPLHEEDRADLSGDYLIYRRETDEDLLGEDSDPHELHFFNSDSGSDDFREVSASSETYVAYRMRFWHTAFTPTSEPGFLPSEYYDDRPPKPPRTLDAVAPFTDSEFDEFVEGVQDSLDAEFQAAQQEAWDGVRTTSVRRLIDAQGGDGIQAASATFHRNGDQLRISAPTSGVGQNPVESTYGIHDGNIVAIGLGDADDLPDIAGVVSSVGLSRVTVRLAWSTADDPETLREDLRTADTVSVAIIERNIAFVREQEAFDTMTATGSGQRLLAGNDPLTFESPLSVRLDTSLPLNRFQRQAAINALRTNHAYCIHGPPGTGKTRTLTAIIESTIQSGGRVLVCAHSNQAVDNLIAGESSPSNIDEESLHGLIQEHDYNLARVGNRGNFESSVVGSFYADEDPRRTQIVATTTNSAARIDDLRFDLVVVEEATQVSIPATAVPLPLGRRVVLAGDHKQLPPYHASETDTNESLFPSLFEHILDRFGEAAKTTLRRQYRMHEVIADFSNGEFYDGLLLHGEGNREATINDLDPLVGIHISDEEVPHGDSWANPREAEIVAAQVQRLLNNDIDPDDIGVITPYTGQQDAVEGELRSEFGDRIARQSKVQTIDAFQGGQREAIIVSFTRSNSDQNAGFLEFPNEGPRRLNVALTRAKQRLVLIGNWTTLTTRAPHRDTNESCADLYDRLLDFIEESGRMVGL